MKPFEYVLVIISVIIGLALTEMAIGIGVMIKNSQSIQLYWFHILLILLSFMTCLYYWTAIYQMKEVKNWNVFNMGLVFLTSISFYISVQLLFPAESNFNYEKHIDGNIRKIVLIFIIFITSVLVDAYFVRKKTERKYYLIRLAYLIALSIMLVIDMKVLYEVGLVVLTLAQLINIYLNPQNIKDE